MTGDDWASIAYIVLLGGALVSWYLIQNRGGLGNMLKQAAAWVFIFIGVIAVVGLWGDIRQTVQPSQYISGEDGHVTVPRSPDGHYYLTLDVNDAPVRFVIDTGATSVVLSRKDAEAVGLNVDDLQFYGRAQTANGEVRTAPVKLERVALGPVTDRNVRAFVNEGELFGSLLGMSYLQNWKIEIAGGEMILRR